MEESDSPPPLNAWRTIRAAVRESWDALGLLCAVSMTLFVASSLPIFFGLRSLPLGIIAACLLIGPLFAGACFLAHRVFQRDEAGYLDLWIGFRKLWVRAVGIALLQAFVLAALAANLWFYGSRPGFGFTMLSILFWYMILFWAINCLYHYPLLVAAAENVIPREAGSPVSLRSVFRNALLLALTRPGYSVGWVLALIAISVPLAISAVGMALIGSGFPAFLATRATRDHLILHGLIPPDPDLETPVVDEVWKMRG